MKRLNLACFIITTLFVANTSAFCSKDIFTSIMSGTIEEVKSYIKSGGDVNAKDENGCTLLIWACLLRDADFVKLLIDANADVNLTQNGFSPLMAACAAEKPENIRLIISTDTDIDAKNSQGYTALIMASSIGNSEIVNQLLAAKADPMIQDNEGKTAFDWASSNNHMDIALMLTYPAKRRSSWDSYIPNHITSNYLTADNFNPAADTNKIRMKVNITKKRAFEFYREELIKEGWNINQAMNEGKETPDKGTSWGILSASNGTYNLTMTILSDQYTGNANTQIDVTLFNQQPGNGIISKSPQAEIIYNQINQRFSSEEWAVTVLSVSNEGNSIKNTDNFTGRVYSYSVNAPHIALISAKINIERLNKKPIKESFLSVGVKVGDTEGNEYPTVAARTGTTEFYDLIIGGKQSIMLPVQPKSDIEYVFAVPEGKVISYFIWPEINPIKTPAIQAYLSKSINYTSDNQVTKVYESGEYVGEFRNNQRNGQGSYTWLNGEFKGDKYVGEFVDDQIHGQGTYTWANGDKYVGEWQSDYRNGQGTYTWANGEIYIGKWVNNVINGQGERTWANGEKYAGEWLNGLMNGKGIYTWADGSTYVGEWENDNKSGQGEKTWANGDKYTGGWKDNVMNGEGRYIWANGTEYIGEMKNGMFDGQGEKTWANGEKYAGEWKDDVRIGKGIYIWASGEKYDGEWNNDLRNGEGTYVWINGDKYEGEWKDNEMYDGIKYNKDGTKIETYSEGVVHLIGKWQEIKEDGTGTYLWTSGDIYAGECKDGIINGKGMKTWVNGDKYVGEFRDGRISGQGEKTWADGGKYTGGWENDDRHGQGSYIWANGDSYVGEWKNNIKEGQGTYIWADGEKYTGEYKNNQRNGQGTYYWTNGDIYIGEWKDNEMYTGKKYNSKKEEIASYLNGAVQ